MSQYTDKQMQIAKSPRAELRCAQAEFRATKHSRLDQFEQKTDRAELMLRRLAPVLRELVAVVVYGLIGTAIGVIYALWLKGY